MIQPHMNSGKVDEMVIADGARLNASCEYLDIANVRCVLVDVNKEQPAYEEECQCTTCRIDLLEMRYKQNYTLAERVNKLPLQKD